MGTLYAPLAKPVVQLLRGILKTKGSIFVAFIPTADSASQIVGFSATTYDKYGEDVGIDKFKSTSKNRNMDIYLVNKAISVIGSDYDSFSRIYGELVFEKCQKKGSASKESLKALIPLYKKIRRLGISRNDIMIGVIGSKEYCILNNKKRYYFDFTIVSKNVIIEYNNKRWHPDPEVMCINEWNAWKHPFKNEYAKDKYISDVKKEQIALRRGFRVYKIWNHLNIDDQIDEIVEKIFNEK